MKKKRTYLIIIFLIIACFVSFGRIVGNDFINFDDRRLITENSHIQDGINIESIKWAFTDSHTEYWNPLTWLSIMVDWRLFGTNASGHHFVSLLLHIGAVLFLFLFLNKTTKSFWPSVFATAFFALHPLRVESVAWAAERKDVLSMFFGMATLYAYAFYTESSKLSRYFICLMLFALSLMSKPMLVTMPFVLLLLDYWPLGRLHKAFHDPIENRYRIAGKLFWEKAPFFIFTAVSIGVTLWSQWTGIASLDRLNITDRGLNAILSYFNYIVKFVYPVDLAVFYPYPDSVPFWQVSFAALFLLGISIAVIYKSQKVPFLFVGWFWYLGTLIPVIGLVQAGHQVMADRYTYLPSIGIAIMLAWGIPLLFRRKDIRKNVLFTVGAAVIATLMFLSWMQCGYWKNDMTLSNHALRVTKNNYIAHNILASYLGQEKRIKEAISHYNESLRLNPYYHYTYNNRGALYRKIGQHQSAIEDFNSAIGLKQNFAVAYINRGETYFHLGQYQAALEDFNKALQIKPYDAIAYNNRGGVYLHLGQYQLAIKNFDKAINLKHNYASAYSNRAYAYLVQGNKKMGCNDAQKACELGDCITLNTSKDKGSCR